MFINVNTFAVIAACALAVHAQSSTTSTAPSSQSSLPAGLDTCILACLTEAAGTGGCTSYTDLQCVCTSTAFQGAALQCLQNNCTADDVTVATQLQSQECAQITNPNNTPVVSPSSGSAPASTTTPTGTSTSTSTTHASSTTPPSSTTPSSTTTKNAAVGLVAPFAFEGTFAALVASAGALLGAAFVL
ncbi:hypothetical protein BS17DRAFT_811529 [Gyrodon lividus]|nr:hypothetical protein BS17DRAFT_811529 [Gyrodon lividus]